MGVTEMVHESYYVFIISVLFHNLFEALEKEEIEMKVFSFLESNPLPSLPIFSETVRPSPSCPQLMEKEILREVTIKHDNGSSEVFLYPEVILVETENHVTLLYEEKPWLKGNVTIRPILNCLQPDSEEFLEIVKKSLLHGPPPESSWTGYNFSVENPDLNGEDSQPLMVDNLVFNGEKKGGFFIEAGSQDGERLSNSLYFEILHGWTGLLVEPHPLFYRMGLMKSRKVTSVQTCLSPSNRPSIYTFDLFSALRTSSSSEESREEKSDSGLIQKDNERNTTVEMQCLPLHSLLLAMGNPTVDYFSLDIEGAEFPVLQSIPWDKVDIRVLTVETHMAGLLFPGTRSDIIAYMRRMGYILVEDSPKRKKRVVKDDLFVRFDVFDEIEGRKQKTEL